MTISAKILADSLNDRGQRLTTFQLSYHRFVHAELMTHRVFSRNASSSRAIPVERMIGWVKDDPAIPVEWGANQKGMQAKSLLPPDVAARAEEAWLRGRDAAIRCTEELLALGVHKQIANRPLEPWHHIAVVVTAADYANWFTLRWHPDAQPEIRELAKAMARVYIPSRPRLLAHDDWHMPYVSDDERATYDWRTCLKLSVARCARVSFKNHDGTDPDVAADLALHDRLAVAKPLHSSPAEHQAKSEGPHGVVCQGGNFGRGWIQYRKTLPNECARDLPWVTNPGMLAEL